MLLLAHALFVLSVPAAVVGVVSGAARPSVAPPSDLGLRERRRLWLATALFAFAAGIWIIGAGEGPAAQGPPPRGFGLVEAVAFAVLGLGFGLPALRATGESAAALLGSERRPGGSVDSVRAASLRVRRVSDYLRWSVQAVPFALVLAGAMLLAALIAQPASGDRRLFLPLGFALASVVFVLLYRAWMRDEVSLPAENAGDGRAFEEVERGRTIRRIFAGQVALAGSLPLLSVGLLAVDWSSAAGPSVGIALSVLGGAIGVLGCAFVLASSVSRRRLAASAREVWR
jgi:hypothetical protein